MQEFFESYGLVYDPNFLPSFIKPLLRLFFLLVFGLIGLKITDSTLKRLISIVPGDPVGARRVERRAETLRQIVRSVGSAVLGVLTVLYLATDVAGYDPAPLLAGAGIVGLAIGFGAQSLVKDVIAGFFVLLEDQYGVGDTVRVANLEGVVEEMTLRVTVLRSGDGEVHVIPNGNIVTVTVLSRDWRRAVVDVSLARKEELGRVFATLTRVGEALVHDMPGAILDKPTVVGVEKLTGMGTKVRVAVRTVPSKHGEVEHEWRRRIKEAFDKEGIQLVAE
jgi:small-conductance mechanosensitive channel